MKDPINLSIGQPDFDVPQAVKTEAIEAIRRGENKYTQTQGAAQLRNAVIQRCGQEFNWDDDQFNLYVSGGPSLEVTDLYFNAGDLTINAGSVGIGISGEFNIDINTATSEIKISSGGGVSLQLSDLEINLGSTLDVSIIGSLEIQADGYIIFAPGVFKANFNGALNLGTGGSYCEFEINGDRFFMVARGL